MKMCGLLPRRGQRSGAERKGMVHELKELPEFFEAVASGKKRFEVRLLDRPFAVGDLLALNEFDERGEGYTGRSLVVGVDYVLSDPKYVPIGHVILGIRPCEVVWAYEEDSSVPLATGRRKDDGQRKAD